MLKRVKDFIENHKLFQNRETIICAVSGGVDSICLLHILNSLGYSTVLAHVNHHKRQESIIEEKEMQALAKQMNISFEVLHFYDTHKENFQSEAHNARYVFFKSLASKYNTKYIATAHHLDDQAETILMRFLSGSNLYGYGGISISYKEDNVEIVRPLLCCSKDELYTYAKENSLIYFEDSSNQDDSYLRNRLRHHIIPKLKEMQPDFLNKAQEFSIQTKDAFHFIRKQSIKYLDELNNNISIASFSLLDIALQKDILCLLFERYQLEKNTEVIHSCLKLLNEGENKKIDLRQGYFFSSDYGLASIQGKTEPLSFKETLFLDGSCVILGKYHFYFSKKIPQNNEIYIKLCYNDLKLPFLIRNRTKGDFIEMGYGNKKVARIMIDAKIPTKKRDEIPLIFDDGGNLLWVYNLAKSKEVIQQKSKGDIFLICEEFKNEK